MPPIVKNNKIEPKIIVLTTNSEEKSAKKLGFDTFTYYPNHIQDFKNVVVLRYGNGFLEAIVENPIFAETDDFPNVINPAAAISLNVIKDKALENLSKHVLTPQMYKDFVPKGKKVVYRENAHSFGKGFKVRKGGFKVEEGRYATDFITTKREVRVFVCDNKTLTCSRRKTNKKDSDICRSNWDYYLYRKTPARLHKLALKAAKATNLQICALDIIVKNKKYYVLENNSCPTLNKRVAEFYKKNIPILIKKKFPKLFKKK